jgi:hypothetical protein
LAVAPGRGSCDVRSAMWPPQGPAAAAAAAGRETAPGPGSRLVSCGPAAVETSAPGAAGGQSAAQGPRPRTAGQ